MLYVHQILIHWYWSNPMINNASDFNGNYWGLLITSIWPGLNHHLLCFLEAFSFGSFGPSCSSLVSTVLCFACCAWLSNVTLVPPVRSYQVIKQSAKWLSQNISAILVDCFGSVKENSFRHRLMHFSLKYCLILGFSYAACSFNWSSLNLPSYSADLIHQGKMICCRWLMCSTFFSFQSSSAISVRPSHWYDLLHICKFDSCCSSILTI